MTNRSSETPSIVRVRDVTLPVGYGTTPQTPPWSDAQPLPRTPGASHPYPGAARRLVGPKSAHHGAPLLTVPRQGEPFHLAGDASGTPAQNPVRRVAENLSNAAVPENRRLVRRQHEHPARRRRQEPEQRMWRHFDYLPAVGKISRRNLHPTQHPLTQRKRNIDSHHGLWTR